MFSETGQKCGFPSSYLCPAPTTTDKQNSLLSVARRYFLESSCPVLSLLTAFHSPPTLSMKFQLLPHPPIPSDLTFFTLPLPQLSQLLASPGPSHALWGLLHHCLYGMLPPSPPLVFAQCQPFISPSLTS